MRSGWLMAIVVCLAVNCMAQGADPAPVTPAGALRVGRLPVGKVLFLGNSITLHGPAENIGWSGNWGMAASAAEKDYVHLLLGKLTSAAKGKPTVMVRNIADFERQFETYDLAAGLRKELGFTPDLVIVAIGENVPALASDESKTKYRAAFAKLLAELAKRGRPTVFVRGAFWTDAAKDELMKQTCHEAGGVFVDLGKLDKDPAHFARSERKIAHDGVAAHPGDKGMQAISDALWSAIQAHASSKKP